MQPPPDWAPERRFVIIGRVAEVPGYAELFEQYGYGGNGPSWAEHIRAILSREAPELLDGRRLVFDEEGDTFYAYADGQQTVNRFLEAVRPAFGSRQALQRYLQQADPEEFIE